MARVGFGAFLAPHHPIGEHPMLQFRRDLDLAEHLDKLGFEFVDGPVAPKPEKLPGARKRPPQRKPKGGDGSSGSAKEPLVKA